MNENALGRTLSSVTFGITFYLRLRDLTRCLKSIERQFPGAIVDTQNTHGNLSWARNELVDRCKTKYYFLLEEDMLVTEETNLQEMHQILEEHENLAGVGLIMNQRGRLLACAAVFERKSKGRYWSVDSQEIDDSGRFIWCDRTHNCGLFRTQALRETRWDEELWLAEHEEFYWRMWRNGKYRMALGRGTIVHRRSRPGQEYNQQRFERMWIDTPKCREKLGVALKKKYSDDSWGEALGESARDRLRKRIHRRERQRIEQRCRRRNT